MDTRLPEIEEEAGHGEGHVFEGLKIRPLDQLLGVAYDLEASLFMKHPSVPSEALYDFWRSWQVYLHVAELCRHRLFTGNRAGEQVGSSDRLTTFSNEYELNKARVLLDRLISSHAWTVGQPTGFHDDLEKLPSQLKAARKKAAESQVEAATTIGINVRTYRAFERGEKTPSRPEVVRTVRNYIQGSTQ